MEGDAHGAIKRSTYSAKCTSARCTSRRGMSYRDVRAGLDGAVIRASEAEVRSLRRRPPPSTLLVLDRDVSVESGSRRTFDPLTMDEGDVDSLNTTPDMDVGDRVDESSIRHYFRFLEGGEAPPGVIPGLYRATSGAWHRQDADFVPVLNLSSWRRLFENIDPSLPFIALWLPADNTLSADTIVVFEYGVGDGAYQSKVWKWLKKIFSKKKTETKGTPDSSLEGLPDVEDADLPPTSGEAPEGPSGGDSGDPYGGDDVPGFLDLDAECEASELILESLMGLTCCNCRMGQIVYDENGCAESFFCSNCDPAPCA